MGKFADLVALAKAGYTPAQVKEILQMDGSKEEGKPEEAAAILPKAEEQPDQPKQEPAPEQPQPSEDNSNAAMDELKQSVQKLTTELEKAKKDLAAAQKLNTSKPAGQKAPDTTIEDIARSFM